MGSYRREIIEKLNGGGKIYEEELLNMLLANAYSGRDYSALSKALLKRFPSVRAIIGASFEEIMTVEGMTKPVAVYFKTLELLIRAESKREIYIRNTADAFKTADERFALKDNECVEIYFLNKSGLVTEIKSYTSRKSDRVDVETGNLFTAITTSGAHAVCFAHNHVNCPARPSPNDDEATKKLLIACEVSGVKFFDHIIISSSGESFSYLESGRLAELKKSLKAW